MTSGFSSVLIRVGGIAEETCRWTRIADMRPAGVSRFGQRRTTRRDIEPVGCGQLDRYPIGVLLSRRSRKAGGKSVANPQGVSGSLCAVAYPLAVSSLEQTMDEKTYTVDGMSCSHCVLSVREEVAEVAGVRAVDVDLASGRLVVRGDAIEDAAVKAAVADAGYEVAS
jgi:copper chaperone